MKKTSQDLFLFPSAGPYKIVLGRLYYFVTKYTVTNINILSSNANKFLGIILDLI